MVENFYRIEPIFTAHFLWSILQGHSWVLEWKSELLDPYIVAKTTLNSNFIDFACGVSFEVRHLPKSLTVTFLLWRSVDSLPSAVIPVQVRSRHPCFVPYMVIPTVNTFNGNSEKGDYVIPYLKATWHLFKPLPCFKISKLYSCTYKVLFLYVSIMLDFICMGFPELCKEGKQKNKIKLDLTLHSFCG